MAEAFIVRRGGGGGSGGTLVVTSSGAGTVTVSNSALGKSYSKSVTAGGSVTFKGLKTGEWTVTLSNGTQTTTTSVTVNADYSVSVAYFSATISVTYPANSTCTCTDGTTTLTDTNTGTSTRTKTFTVLNTGTWTITATATDGSGKSKSQTVSITADGQSESVTLSYELVLFEAGNQHADITGGWDITSGSVSTAWNYIFKDYIQVRDQDESDDGVVSTNNKLDLSLYSKLNVIIKTLGDGVGGGNWYGYVSAGSAKWKSSTYGTTQSNITASLDISSISSGVIKVGVHASYDAYMRVSKIWLS